VGNWSTGTGRRHALLAAALASVAVACTPVRPDQAVRIATGSVSHTLCSQTFVGGLDPDQVYAETMRPEPGMGLINWLLRYQVDTSRGEVRTAVAGGFENRAIYRQGLGCVLVHESDTERLSAGVTPDPPAAPLLPEIAGPSLVEPENDALRAALDRAFAEPDQPPWRWTKAVVVVHDGRIVAERYAPGYGIDTPLPGNSATKSVVSALIGILARDGQLAVMQPAPVPAWSDPGDPRHAITVDELLRMTSGLPLDEYRGGWDRASRMWFLESDQAGFAETASLDAPPGTVWNYSDGSYAILARIIRDRVGGSAADVFRFAHRELFDPLGMRSVTVEFDATGTPVGSRSMLASARDWARFGVLYLNDGVVGGQRILPEGWVAYSSSQTLDTGYGAGFWINVTDREISQWGIQWGMPHAPRDTFFAFGYLGQYVVIVPSAHLVVARFGITHRRGFDTATVGQLVADVIAATAAQPTASAAPSATAGALRPWG